MSTRTLRILVAEDNDVNQMLTTRFLQHLGHAAVPALDGREVLAALEREAAAGRPVDLVLMDVQMPGMTGLEAAVAIRAETSGRFDPRVPIIALTAHTMDEERRACLEAGMDGHISKPIELEELQAAVLRYAKD